MLKLATMCYVDIEHSDHLQFKTSSL